MIKKVLGVAFVALSLASVSSYAQTNENATCDANKVCVEKNRKCDKKAACKNGEVAGKIITLDEFEGINLTDNQKSQLTALKQEQRAKMKAVREQQKAEKATAKSEKSELTKEQRMAKRQEMENARKADRKEYLSKVKNIIGDTNYVTFLENQYVQSSPKAFGQKQQSIRKADKKAQRDGKQFAHKSDRKQSKASKAGRK